MKIATRLALAILLIGCLGHSASIAQDLVWDNGAELVANPAHTTLINCPGCGTAPIAGADLSQAEHDFARGQGHRQSTGHRIADDFTVSAGGWLIDHIQFYAYQTNSGTTSTISGVTLRIWDGPPGEVGSTVVFGDETTDRMVGTSFTGIFRTTDPNTTDGARPVMVQTVVVDHFLPAGEYWLDWSSSGSIDANVFAPSVTLEEPTVNTVTGNALKREGFAAEWEPYTFPVEDGSPKGFPFQIYGYPAGWRMLSPPYEGATVADLANMSLVQGVGSEHPNAQPNVYIGYTGDPFDPGTVVGYAPATSLSDPLHEGRGFLWYLWPQAWDPGNSEGGGVSQSAGLPLVLVPNGSAPVGDVDTPFDASDRFDPTADDGFFLVGNPFDGEFDLEGVSVSAEVAVTLQNTFWRWNAATRDWEGFEADENDTVEEWHGFFAEVDGLTQASDYPVVFTFDSACVGGCVRQSSPQVERYRVALELHGTVGGRKVFDGAASVVFAEDASEGWDRRDASKLYPMGNGWAILSPMGDRHGEHVAKAVESRPIPNGYDFVPIAFSALSPGQFAISIGDRTDVPDSWILLLEDTATGQLTDLRSQTVTFSVDELTWMDERFILRVDGQPVSTGNEAQSRPFGIDAAYPNPFVASARVVFHLAQAGEAEVALYDVLGRRVAVLSQGEHEAGQHSVDVRAGSLASGVYVVRLTSGGQVHSTRLTLLR